MAIIKVSSVGIEKDKFGVKLKYPNRQCKNCFRYPCFPEIEKCSSNFAAYGCTYYREAKLSSLYMTILASLVAKEEDTLGYITYVFECLDKEVIEQTRYIMCTRYPNWNHRDLEIGEVGYLNFVEIRAGIDKWFDGKNMIPYNYNNIQFLKFVPKPEPREHKYIMLITF